MSKRNGYLIRTYGITEEMYEELLDRQNRRCAICERHESEFDRKLAVDHAHAGVNAGAIRGCLCSYCNLRLVGRHHDGNLLRKLAEYVERNTGWYVPKKKKTKKRKPNRGQ